MCGKMNKLVVNKIVNKPRQAFENGCWLDYKTPGAVGPIVWDRLKKESISSHAGISRGGEGQYSITPDFTGTTVPASTCQELADRFSNGLVAGRTGLIYARLGNKNSFELECALTGLHGCGDAMVFGSGMAAISHLILTLVRAGDNIVYHQNIYGCTDDFFSMQLPALGVETRFADFNDMKTFEKTIDNKTRAVFFETPSNPALDLIDIAAIANKVNGRCPVIVDNTFASPLGQNPFEFGANIVVYSLTKSIGGHSNAIGGAVLGSGTLIDELFTARKDFGGMLAAREASAFLDGIKTLTVRYNAMQINAIQVAQMLQKNKEVESVNYPLFNKRYPIHGQMKGPGHMLTFVLKGGMNAGTTFLNSLKMIPNAVSLGCVETLACHPASTTHATVPKKLRLRKGILDGLVRLSIGIEAFEDIKKDINQAINLVARKSNAS